MMLKKWMKRSGLILALPLLLIALLALWVGFKIIAHDQMENEQHLAAKQGYLKKIASISQPVDLSDRAKRPNIIFILYDDLGYSDLGAFGARAIKTPAIDQLAEKGVVLTNFYAPSPVCTPSRAGFMTGRLPPRAGLPNVVFPTGSPLSLTNILADENIRLPAEEITLADMLKAAGYRTKMVGKWHMGDRSPSLPNDMGFQEYFGALYSNDMTPFALYRDTEVAVKAPVDQSELDAIYTREALEFLSGQSDTDEPFFLYFAHNFPHVPLFAANDRSGKSAAGLYGDVVEALDFGVEQIVRKLTEENLIENTIIIISSDNGPWWQGDASALRGRKGQTWEGGMRVPFIIHWPARLTEPRTIDGIAMGTDLVPTVSDWLGLPQPTDRIIDGKSIAQMLESGGETPHDYLYYFAKERLAAVRDQTHKYLGRRSHIYAPMDSAIGLSQKHGPWLIDMRLDDREAYDVSLNDPDKARAMQKALSEKEMQFEQNLRGWIE